MAEIILESSGKNNCDYKRNGKFPDRMNQVRTGLKDAFVFWAEINRTVSIF